MLLLGCGHEPLQKHAAHPKPPVDELGCTAPPPSEKFWMWDPNFPGGGGDTGAAPVQHAMPLGASGNPDAEHKCRQLAELIVRGRDAAAAHDCPTLASIDAEVCAIDPVFLADVYVGKVDHAPCRRGGDAIRECANTVGQQP
jgi:hypothetical protein